MCVIGKPIKIRKVKNGDVLQTPADEGGYEAYVTKVHQEFIYELGELYIFY